MEINTQHRELGIQSFIGRNNNKKQNNESILTFTETFILILTLMQQQA